MRRRGIATVLVALSLLLVSCGSSGAHEDSGGRSTVPSATPSTESAKCAGRGNLGPSVADPDRYLTIDDLTAFPGFEEACPRIIGEHDRPADVASGACGTPIPLPAMTGAGTASIGEPPFGAGVDEIVGTVDRAAGAAFVAAEAADIRPGCPSHVRNGTNNALTDVVPTEGLPGSAAAYTATLTYLDNPVPSETEPPTGNAVTNGYVIVLQGTDLLLLDVRMPGPLDVAVVRSLADKALARRGSTT